MCKLLKTNLCNLIFFEVFSTPYIHRNCVGGEFDIERGVEIIDCLDESDAAYLK